MKQTENMRLFQAQREVNELKHCKLKIETYFHSIPMKHDSIKQEVNEGLLSGSADSAISILCLMRAISISLSQG